jgi:hypothetical protein
MVSGHALKGRGNVISAIMRSETWPIWPQGYRPICGSQRTINTRQLPAVKTSELDQDQPAVSATCTRTEVKPEES